MGWSLDWAFAPTSCRREHTKPYPNRLGYIPAGPSQAPRSWVQQTIIRLWGVILFSDHSKLWYYVRQRVHASIAPSTTIKKKKEEPVSVSIISNFSVRRFQIASILRRCWSFGLKGNAQSCWIGSCREVHKVGPIQVAHRRRSIILHGVTCSGEEPSGLVGEEHRCVAYRQ